jgi:hypothetical protein
MFVVWGVSESVSATVFRWSVVIISTGFFSILNYWRLLL